ncbi:type IV secretion system DNA-binding domain-containing protein [Rhizobium sp. RU36D]|uniref:type IV secretory system conjugative DNA transfer family protein n=1 Tax=Rhizobium sp. RU36D TaxID=1907415 RepID=UPI0009D807AF|nr:type IV secretion system DNA-binding domain-containing protein [Rhizobium sp. RU36D]SMD16436.1 TraM recognition site of TraD and TraG [Rhizobium sp. RU36D]
MVKFINKLAAKVLDWNDRVFASSADPLLRGDLVEYGRAKYPPEHYQTMWMDIPEDIKRRITWDGRLPNGDMPAELAKQRVTDELVKTMLVQSGRKALWISGVIAAVVIFMSSGGFDVAFDGRTPYPAWAADNGAWLPVASWYLLTIIERVGGLLGGLSKSAAMLVPLLLLFPVIWWWAFNSYMDRMWRKLALPYRYPSSDTQHFWKQHVAERIKDYAAYKGTIAEALRIADQPLFGIGTALGITDARGDNLAPKPGQLMCMDAESLRQGTYISGKTGSGKTSLVFVPTFKALMSDVWGKHKSGAYVTDGKATLWRDLLPLVEHRKSEVFVIGTDENQHGIDLIHGMSPLEVSAMFESVDSQISGPGAAAKDPFWKVSASDCICYSAQIALMLERHPGAVKEWLAFAKVRPYSLMTIYQIATQPKFSKKAVELFYKVGMEILDGVPGVIEGIPEADGPGREAFAAAREAASWFLNTFLVMSPGQRDGIVGNVSAVLGKLRASRTVVDRFCSGSVEQAIDVDHALRGGIIMIAIGSSSELGVVGKLIATWLKTRLMLLAARRLEKEGKEVCSQSSCALFADEFQMLCTTVGEQSDVEAWNKNRQTGLYLICATQNISALRLKMGDTATANFLSQMNTKIILENDEKETIKWAEETSGQLPWSWQPDPRFYSTQAARELLIGNDSELAEMETLDGIIPSMFVPVTDQVEDGWGGAIMRAPKDALRKVLGKKRGVQTYMQEGQNGFEGETVMHQFQPKIRQSDLQTGSGYAMAMIRRANSTRVDMIDLRINSTPQ